MHHRSLLDDHLRRRKLIAIAEQLLEDHDRRGELHRSVDIIDDGLDELRDRAGLRNREFWEIGEVIIDLASLG